MNQKAGVSKGKEGEVTCDACCLLTCKPNAEVKRVHKAMPVILTTTEEYDAWMRPMRRGQDAYFLPGDVHAVMVGASIRM